MSDIVARNALPGQISRFAVIGLIATGVHLTVAGFAHYGLGMTPLVANFVAFLVAFGVSFTGHYFWTFGQTSSVRSAMVRFFLVSVSGLAINQAIVWIVVNVMGQSFLLAMALAVLIIPVASFVSSKFWAFKAQSIN